MKTIFKVQWTVLEKFGHDDHCFVEHEAFRETKSGAEDLAHSLRQAHIALKFREKLSVSIKEVPIL